MQWTLVWLTLDALDIHLLRTSGWDGATSGRTHTLVKRSIKCDKKSVPWVDPLPPVLPEILQWPGVISIIVLVGPRKDNVYDYGVKTPDHPLTNIRKILE